VAICPAALPEPDGHVLSDAQVLQEPSVIWASWQALVFPFLQDCGLTIPTTPFDLPDRSQHTLHLAVLLYEMQAVAHREPLADWQ